MARPLRIAFPGAFYHVTARGNERKTVFKRVFNEIKTDHCLKRLVEKIEKMITMCDVGT